MKYLEFIKLANESTKCTPNVRISTKSLEISSTYPDLDDSLLKIGSIVTLIQAQINQGLYCKKSEYILLYDFQAVNYKRPDLYKVIGVVKPKSEIDETHNLKGKPFEIMVNINNGKLMATHLVAAKKELISKSSILQQMSKSLDQAHKFYFILIQSFFQKQPTVPIASHTFQLDGSTIHTDGYIAPKALEDLRMVERLNHVAREFQTLVLKSHERRAWLSKQGKTFSNQLTFIKNYKSGFLDQLNTKIMPNVRISTKSCRINGVYQVPYYILERVGCIIALIQAQIDKGFFCKKNQFLLLYNFQSLTEHPHFYSIDMVIRSISKISETDVIKGQPLQLVVNGITGEVMNNAKCMLELGLLSEFLVTKQGLEPPKSYGNYYQYAKPSNTTEFIKSKSQPNLNCVVQSKKAKRIKPALSPESTNKSSKLPLTFSIHPTSSAVNTNLCILIAEDNIVNQKMTSKILQQAGHLHFVANNGKQAVEFYTKLPSIDIILMDVVMPLMNGIEATKVIRELERQSSSINKRTIIIALTGNTNQQDIDNALKAGMDGYLAKPCNKDLLLQTINDQMRNRLKLIGSKISAN